MSTEPGAASKPHLTGDRPLFSARYGVQDPPRALASERPWASRHKTTDCDGTHLCICPGIEMGSGCCDQQMTQEDGVCDECRAFCYAVDDDDNRYPLAAVAARR